MADIAGMQRKARAFGIKPLVAFFGSAKYDRSQQTHRHRTEGFCLIEQTEVGQ
jgi:hypothetical protein